MRKTGVLLRHELRVSGAYLDFVKGIPHPVNRGSVIGRTLIEGKAVQISDVLSDAELPISNRKKWWLPHDAWRATPS